MNRKHAVLQTLKNIYAYTKCITVPTYATAENEMYLF